MKTSWFGIGSVLLLLIFFVVPLVAQPGPGEGGDDTPGPVGSVDDPEGEESEEEEDSTPDVEKFEPFPGPMGRVSERLENDECATCFTVPSVDPYQIFESIETPDKEEILIRRLLPNPAPLQTGEVRERVDESTGEDIWYIGDQAYVGPTDEDYWSDEAPLVTIALKRIQMKYLDTIMSIPGVHGFGIISDGFEVELESVHSANASRIPTSLDGVPVTVKESEVATMQHHGLKRFRPLPAGASIGVRVPNPETGKTETVGGTLGPTVVRNRPYVIRCCQLWSLTAAHVVQYTVTDPIPRPLTRLVYQPFKLSPPATDLIGSVIHTFQLTPCGEEETKNACLQSNAPKNWTHSRPDIAAIDHGLVTYPFNTPVGTKPTRKLARSSTSLIHGPSGKIMSANRWHRHEVWGAVSAQTRTLVYSTNRCKIIEDENTETYYKVCGLNGMFFGTYPGDSGALVAYAGKKKDGSDRHIAGVVVAGDGWTSWYIPADDIKTAFKNSRVNRRSMGFSHFWGTRSGYRRPSGRTCDAPKC